MLHVAQDAQVVDAVRVVGVVVRVDHAVEALDARTQELLAKVRRGVDNDRCHAFRPDLLGQDRAAPAPVLRVVGVAGPPIVADARNAHGCTAAEDP